MLALLCVGLLAVQVEARQLATILTEALTVAVCFVRSTVEPV